MSSNISGKYITVPITSVENSTKTTYKILPHPDTDCVLEQVAKPYPEQWSSMSQSSSISQSSSNVKGQLTHPVVLSVI